MLTPLLLDLGSGSIPTVTAAQVGYLSPLGMIIQYFTNTGVILAGGNVATYAAGTTTLASTFTDATLSVANRNPIKLLQNGRTPGSIWQVSGTKIKAVITDAANNPIITIDNLQGINDPVSSLGALANPLSGFGVDLVANALRSYDGFASLRAVKVPVLATGQTTIVILEGGISVNDTLGGAFYWNATSSAPDDNKNTIQPTAATGLGRFVRVSWPAQTSVYATSGLDALGGTQTLGWINLPQNVQNQNYSIVLADQGREIYHSSASTHTYTIPANGSVPFPVGTVIDFVNDQSAGALTIAINTDTLVWFPSGAAGSRTIVAPGTAQAKKITTTKWCITGVGLT